MNFSCWEESFQRNREFANGDEPQQRVIKCVVFIQLFINFNCFCLSLKRQWSSHDDAMAIDSVWDTRWTLNVFSTNLFRDSNGWRYTTDQQHEYTDLMSEVVNLSPKTCIDTVSVSISLIFLSACSDCFFFFVNEDRRRGRLVFCDVVSLTLLHVCFCSCRMSTLTHSFRVCYLQFALTRDNHPKERKISKCCRFSLVPAGQYCWFECPTSSLSKELVHLCVYFIQSGTW